MSFETIHNFFIDIGEKSLIICDIDETIITRHKCRKKRSKTHKTLQKIESLLPSYTHKESFLMLKE